MKDEKYHLTFNDESNFGCEKQKNMASFAIMLRSVKPGVRPAPRLTALLTLLGPYLAIQEMMTNNAIKNSEICSCMSLLAIKFRNSLV